MIRKETTPNIFRSELISSIKKKREQKDPRKRDFKPEALELPFLDVYLARHFGFCFGVENAIEIAYKAVDEFQKSGDSGSAIYLLSEMIHNPDVNNDLLSYGVRFLCDTKGNQLIPFTELNPNDIVILPAFGISLEVEADLAKQGVDLKRYDTTCPFVVRVWKKAKQIASNGYTVVIHGKPEHEETRATFSHVANYGPTIVIRDVREAELLASFISKNRLSEDSLREFSDVFKGRFSKEFNPSEHLEKLGVVNQTTMLAEDTLAVTEVLRRRSLEEYHTQNIESVFADTRDTLCYATSENQRSVLGMLELDLDFVVVVGGFNSSNTIHLAKLASKRFRAYHVTDALSFDNQHITFRDTSSGSMIKNSVWLSEFASKFVDGVSLKVGITAETSTPDSVIEEVINSLAASVASFAGTILISN
jgi:4-hydroxy-3-methylbut-2-en-1-yl diphosphate reductase